MGRVDGTAARKLDFEDGVQVQGDMQLQGGAPLRALRLAPARVALRGPGKYAELERRRRRAQIAARRLLDLID
jgi:hypothetical protein